MKKLYSTFYLLVFTMRVLSQDYHAIYGSSFAGSLGADNNPAAIVNTPFPWDVTVFAFQLSSATNAFTILNYSLLSNPAKSLYRINQGNFSRYANNNFNLHLFNMRFAINRRQAVAFGANIRGYTAIKSGTFNYIDTVKNLADFLKINERNPVLNAAVKNSTWIEAFGTYSQTIRDDEISRLNAGITLKVGRGISGAFGNLGNINVRRDPQSRKPVYYLQSGNVQYGYSANIDNWKKGNSSVENLKGLLHNAQFSLSADLGVEYIIKSQAVTNYNDEDSYYEYEWKIGASLLDIGSTQYNYGIESRSVNSPKINISDSLLNRRFVGTGSVRQFNDSLATIADDVTNLAGSFGVIRPTRLVLNADRSLPDNFYVNAELSLNLFALASPEKLYVNELSLITVTPRWETRRLGVYLPIQYNSVQQFLVGVGFKAGPLLLGVHNLANIFAKNKTQNGGGYIALVIRPSMLTRAYRDKRNNCPE